MPCLLLCPRPLTAQKISEVHLEGRLFEFTCFPIGIALAPRKITILLKPVYAKLHQMGHSNAGYIDDSLLLADTIPECKLNVKDTVEVMTDLGFLIHQNKSVFVPTQNLIFLGNHINSQKMIVYLLQEKYAHSCLSARS